MFIKVDAERRARFLIVVVGVGVGVGVGGSDRIRIMSSGGSMFRSHDKTNNGQTLFRFHVERRFLVY